MICSEIKQKCVGRRERVRSNPMNPLHPPLDEASCTLPTDADKRSYAPLERHARSLCATAELLVRLYVELANNIFAILYPVYTIPTVVKPVEQPVGQPVGKPLVSCKRGIRAVAFAIKKTTDFSFLL